jgi:hypothetical protein
MALALHAARGARVRNPATCRVLRKERAQSRDGNVEVGIKSDPRNDQ